MAKEKQYQKLAEAPDDFQPGVEVGDTFSAEFSEDQERALVAAGWVEPSKSKKGEEK